ncbi:MAG: hypothetical protein MJA29_14355, partial [Candidatus Omnitrophica bacterium]|nr:hypothetical protein [Candidatus Omnitrophota bacterium]
ENKPRPEKQRHLHLSVYLYGTSVNSEVFVRNASITIQMDLEETAVKQQLSVKVHTPFHILPAVATSPDCNASIT